MVKTKTVETIEEYDDNGKLAQTNRDRNGGNGR